MQNHQSPHIDFLTFHCWPNNWGDPTDGFAKHWVGQHVVDAKLMEKPVLLQEFGNKVLENGPTKADRDRYFKVMYSEIVEGMRTGPLVGAMFWQW